MTTDNEITEEPIQQHWTETELEQTKSGNSNIERLPYVKFVENQITVIRIDATKPFEKYTEVPKGNGQDDTRKVKAIIPCMAKDTATQQWTRHNLWLNVRNPLYTEILRACKDAVDRSSVQMSILQTGTQKNTKYVVVKSNGVA